jgi:hypothetical protein
MTKVLSVRIPDDVYEKFLTACALDGVYYKDALVHLMSTYGGPEQVYTRPTCSVCRLPLQVHYITKNIQAFCSVGCLVDQMNLQLIELAAQHSQFVDRVEFDWRSFFGPGVSGRGRFLISGDGTRYNLSEVLQIKRNTSLSCTQCGGNIEAPGIGGRKQGGRLVSHLLCLLPTVAQLPNLQAALIDMVVRFNRQCTQVHWEFAPESVSIK